MCKNSPWHCYFEFVVFSRIVVPNVPLLLSCVHAAEEMCSFVVRYHVELRVPTQSPFISGTSRLALSTYRWIQSRLLMPSNYNKSCLFVCVPCLQTRKSDRPLHCEVCNKRNLYPGALISQMKVKHGYEMPGTSGLMDVDTPSHPPSTYDDIPRSVPSPSLTAVTPP